MKCQFCDRPATVHLTRIVKQQKREVHLCESCATKHQTLPTDTNTEVNVPGVLHFLFPTAGGDETPEATPMVCPECGMKYPQFRAEGRLGCAHDYDAFREPLLPLFDKIHQARQHVGKVPKRRRKATTRTEREQLEAQLRAAVAQERYEDAAQLRDLIRTKGNGNGSEQSASAAG